MRPKFLLWTLASLLALAGCLPSLNAVFTEETLIFDPHVVGVWVQPKSEAKWDFQQRDEKSYTLVYSDHEGRQAQFIAHLAEVDGTLFLDLLPEKVESAANPFFDLHFVPMHTIYAVRQVEPVLQLAAIDYGWLDKFLTENPQAIQHAVFNGRKLITAPTKDVQAFVAANQEQFSANVMLEREAVRAR